MILAQRDPFESFLHNNLRNGTLLCTLIGMLDKHRASKIPRSKVYRNPATIVQARNNIELALRTLIRRGHKDIPAPYLLQTEEILKGNRAVIWGLLYHMKMTFKAPKGFHTGSGSPRRLPKVGHVVEEEGEESTEHLCILHHSRNSRLASLCGQCPSGPREPRPRLLADASWQPLKRRDSKNLYSLGSTLSALSRMFR